MGGRQIQRSIRFQSAQDTPASKSDWDVELSYAAIDFMSNWANAFLPWKKARLDSLGLHYARFFILFSLVSILSVLAFGAIMFYLDEVPYALIVVASGLVVLCVPFLYKHTGSLVMCGNVIAFDLLFVAAFAAFVRGGFSVFALSFMIPIPLLMGYLVGQRAALVWAIGVGIVWLLAYVRVALGLPHSAAIVAPSNVVLLSEFLGIICVFLLLMTIVTCQVVSLHALEVERVNREHVIQNQLLQTAHQTGMVELASSLIHYIGNILTSVATSNTTMTGIIEIPGTKDLQAACDLLMDNIDNLQDFLQNDHRGKRLPEFFRVVGEAIEEQYQHLRTELDEQAKLIDRIKGAIHSQAIGVREEVRPKVTVLNLVDAIGDSLAIQNRYCSKHKVQVVRNYPESMIIPVRGEKAKLVHVITNLIVNACEAMLRNQPDNRILEIDIEREEYLVWLMISDNGEGIASENRDQLYRYSFSTRGLGRGMGLFTCAKFVEEMRGGLRIENKDGQKGVCAVLELPKVDPVSGEMPSISYR